MVTRLLLVPLTHTWDGQTWANVFAELTSAGSLLDAFRRPYEVTRELSLLTQAAGHASDFYESWAYPPLMLYVYWPLAHLYTALHGGLQVIFPVQPAYFASSLPVSLLTLIHLPDLLADIGTLALMRKLGVSPRELAWYAFNPLVLLAGVWTFDSVMVFFLVAALLLAERRHWGWCGVLLGLGAATKYVPLVVLPALVAAALWQSGRHGAKRRLLAVFASLAATLAVLVAPVAGGVRYVVQAQMSRFASGLTVQQAWGTWAEQLPFTDWQPRWQLYASGLLGSWLLPLALLAATWLLLRRPLPLRAGFLIMVLAFLAGSKLVNEHYALAPMALLTIQLAHQPSAGLRGCRTLLWVTAFCYAAINTPLWGFAFSLVQQLAPPSATAISHWADAYRLFLSYPESAWPYLALGCAFTGVVTATIWLVAAGGREESGAVIATQLVW